MAPTGLGGGAGRGPCHPPAHRLPAALSSSQLGSSGLEGESEPGCFGSRMWVEPSTSTDCAGVWGEGHISPTHSTPKTPAIHQSCCWSCPCHPCRPSSSLSTHTQQDSPPGRGCRTHSSGFADPGLTPAVPIVPTPCLWVSGRALHVWMQVQRDQPSLWAENRQWPGTFRRWQCPVFVPCPGLARLKAISALHVCLGLPLPRWALGTRMGCGSQRRGAGAGLCAALSWGHSDPHPAGLLGVGGGHTVHACWAGSPSLAQAHVRGL